MIVGERLGSRRKRNKSVETSAFWVKIVQRNRNFSARLRWRGGFAMIICLEPEESSTLTQIAQFSTNPNIKSDMLHELLEDATPRARQIASVLLREVPENQVDSDIQETADYFRKWAHQNVAYAKARIVAG